MVAAALGVVVQDSSPAVADIPSVPPCEPIPGGLQRCYLPIDADALLAQAHLHNNAGADAEGWVKVGNGANRMVMRWSLAPLAGRTVVGARMRLRLTRDYLTSGGTQFATNGLDPALGWTWDEGNHQYNTFSFAEYRPWAHTPQYVAGTGVTWLCTSDPYTLDNKELNCPRLWYGGAPGFRVARTSVTTLFPGSPSQQTSLKCFLAGGRESCFRSVELDVTSDVVDGVGQGRPTASWLISRCLDLVANGSCRFGETGAGAMRWWSREGAVCVAKDAALQPLLVVELVDDGSTPTITSPPDHCATY